jgi:membrane-associated PAP2 superfamily phosphatase
VYRPSNFAGEGLVKNLKFGILAFGALGLISLLMEFEMLKLGLQHDLANMLMVIVGFAAPLAMGVMAMKKPLLMWQAGVALAGFALVAIKFRLWETLPHIMDIPTSMKLSLIADVGGIVVSILALVKPEKA